jgi:hypothetical protein
VCVGESRTVQEEEMLDRLINADRITAIRLVNQMRWDESGRMRAGVTGSLQPPPCR